MTTKQRAALVIGFAVAALLAWWGRETWLPGEPPATPVLAAAPDAAPTEGDRLFAAITAKWTNEQLQACAGAVRDVLGTRDLVTGVLASVKDPQGRAAAELADAKHFVELADAKLAEVRPQLEAGDCSGGAGIALEHATQHLVNAGTSAVQATQIAK
jgi:hypothetical protein